MCLAYICKTVDITKNIRELLIVLYLLFHCYRVKLVKFLSNLISPANAKIDDRHYDALVSYILFFFATRIYIRFIYMLPFCKFAASCSAFYALFFFVYISAKKHAKTRKKNLKSCNVCAICFFLFVTSSAKKVLYYLCLLSSFYLSSLMNSVCWRARIFFGYILMWERGKTRELYILFVFFQQKRAHSETKCVGNLHAGGGQA